MFYTDKHIYLCFYINALLFICLFQNIGKIIERDFFPDLEKWKAQKDYLDAVQQNDTKKLREIYEKYSLSKRLHIEQPGSLYKLLN